MKLTDNITILKGVGAKTAESFAKLGINNIGELISTYPRNYLFYEEVRDINKIKEGERCSVCGIITSYVDVRKVRNLTLVNMTIKDPTGTLKITWFNQPYLRNVFHKGETYVFVGEIKNKNGARTMQAPEYYKLPQYEEMRKVLQPVYGLTAGLSNKTFQKAIGSCKTLIESLPDFLPEEIRKQYNMLDVGTAIESIHFPPNKEMLRKAISRLAFDEFYKFLADVGRARTENIALENSHKIVQGKAVAEFISELPFKLTKGQSNAIEDILSDMGGEGVMNRLVQGDVGSGKTVVAEAAMFACVKAGYQAALMAPTEVLAKQHYEEMSILYEKYGIKVSYLAGSTTAKEKRHIYEAIAEGDTDIVIGTHALIEDKVQFDNLGLVITDEQHRFGVNQRKKLASKGDYPHSLVMSATPIPRTLAIIMYADLDISVISELPKGRKPIKNCVVGTNYRATAYRFITSEIQNGNQVYVICPMVSESDTMDITNVTEYTDTLKQALGNGVNVTMLHGQMKADEKNGIMNDFMEGKIQVLVSTTVIEVGINNPNATVMMVENAERFGLAQLHQLRGRVGRGSKQSYCIFINGNESKESMERLKVLENSNDGFFIAGEDLRLRGPGDFFGIRQSGEALFRLADIYKHTDMLKIAQDIWKNYGDKFVNESAEGNFLLTI